MASFAPGLASLLRTPGNTPTGATAGTAVQLPQVHAHRHHALLFGFELFLSTDVLTKAMRQALCCLAIHLLLCCSASHLVALGQLWYVALKVVGSHTKSMHLQMTHHWSARRQYTPAQPDSQTANLSASVIG